MGKKLRKAHNKPKNFHRGKIDITPKGYGFVKTSEGNFFIPRSKLNGAFPGDIVEIAPIYINGSKQNKKIIYKNFKNREAKIIRVISRAYSTIVGSYKIAEPYGIVVPENKSIQYDIFTLRKGSLTIKENQIVEVEITEYPTNKTAASGKITKVLGYYSDPGVDVDILIAENNLETQFSIEAMQELETISLDTTCLKKALDSGYHDCRQDFVYTIDPVDAKDFDDAISCYMKDSKIYISVHIADVASFVPINSHIDKDAQNRAFSTYLVDRVLPMLPAKLSNEICSLLPNVPRMVLSIDMVFTKKGTLQHFSFHPSIIESKARISYDQALILIETIDEQEMIEKFQKAKKAYGSNSLKKKDIITLSQSVKLLSYIAQCRKKMGKERGVIEFDRLEPHMILDNNGYPTSIKYRKRTLATEAVEQSMILANHLVAKWISKHNLNCIYRVHDIPNQDSLKNLYDFLQKNSNLETIDKKAFISGDSYTLQKVLDLAKTHPFGSLINSLLLQSMSRARYSPNPNRHYGLALDCYCHFTSPIRRYPDLVVHRVLHHAFKSSKLQIYDYENLVNISHHCSNMEHITDHVAIESQDLKLIEYMANYIGERFEGIVTGISSNGLKIRLNNSALGFLPIKQLGKEHFIFDQDFYRLIGQNTGKIVMLGQTLSVIVGEANPRERSLIFSRPK